MYVNWKRNEKNTSSKLDGYSTTNIANKYERNSGI